ncbi:LptF/LptG family permease [bacterium]|nr:LptF/LptG family permease [bacterium]
MASSCLIFGLLASILGISVDRRSGSAKGFILSVFCIGFYWLLVSLSVSLASDFPRHSNWLLWAPNMIFVILTLFFYRRLKIKK